MAKDRNLVESVRFMACIGVISILFFSVPTDVHAADNTSSTNWPQQAEWVALSNHLWQCYTGILDRCRAVNYNITLDPPTNIYPMADYSRFAAALDQLIPYFVCPTNADSFGTFNSWFAINLGYSGKFPMWQRTNVLLCCGVTNSSGSLTNLAGEVGWFTNDILQSWELADHSIQRQITACLTTLVWTCRSYGYGNGSIGWVVPTNGLTNSRFGGGTTTTSWIVAKSLANANFAGRSSSPQAPAKYTKGESNVTYKAEAYASELKVQIDGLYTNVPHNTGFYVYADRPSGGVWDSFGDPVASNQYWLSDTVSSNCLGSNTSTIAIGSMSFPTPWCIPPSSSSTARGYCCPPSSVGLPQALLKWSFPAISTNYISQSPMPDLDRDDIVDMGADIDSFGPDFGTIVFRDDQDLPYVILPIASPPLWYAGLFTHAYLSQGGSGTNLPFHYLIPSLVDNDGYFQAYSLNTRVLQTGCLTNTCVTNKQVSILRPRGNLVAFEFPWTNTAFSEMGYPIGINSNRTYVLHDVTPNVHTDLVYDLYFESGIIHLFGPDGTLTNVCSMDGRSAAVSTNSIPGADIYFPDSATSTRYNVGLRWTNGVVAEITNATKTGSYVLTTVSTNSLGLIYKVSKSSAAVSDISDSDAEVTGSLGTTVSYAWGTVTRTQTSPAGTSRKVSMVTSLDPAGCGASSAQTVTETTGLNLANRVTNNTVSASGYSATNSYEYYTGAGRYTNGSLKSAKLKQVAWADGSSNAFQYAADTGWLVTNLLAVGNGAIRITAFSYNAAHGDAANTNNLVERPRESRSLWREGGTDIVIGKTLAAYSNANWTKIQECTNANAIWDDAGNLYTTNNYYTNTDLSYGLPASSYYPVGSNIFSYAVSAVSTAAIGRLTSVVVRSNVETATNVVNAFGQSELSTVVESGFRTYCEASSNDAFGRPVSVTNEVAQTSGQFDGYGLHGPGKLTGPDGGSVTSNQYYKTGWIRQVNHQSLDRRTDYEYDALGSAKKVTETGGDLSVTNSYVADVQGRTRSHTGLLGMSSRNYANTAFGTQKTASFSGPNGTTTITSESYKDGAVKAISGSGAAATPTYDYAKDPASGRFTSKWTSGASSSETITDYANMLGKTEETKRAGVGPRAKRCYESGTGRLIRSIDEENRCIATVYSSVDGRVSDSGQAMGSAVLTPPSTDRFRTYNHAVTASGISNGTCIYETDNVGTPSTLSTSRTSLDGRGQVNIYAGRTNISIQSAFTGAGAYTVCSTNANKSYTIKRYDKWLLTKVEEYDNGGSTALRTESYGYDGLGALTNSTRTFGGITTVTSIELDSARRVWKVTTSGRGTLKNDYYPGTTLLKKVTREDGSILSYDYHDNGQLKRVYNSAFNLETLYDTEGRKIKELSWKGASTSNLTEWAYHSETGWLDQKNVNGRMMQRYAYLNNGDLFAVTNANAACKIYARNVAGDVTSVSWFGGGTPTSTVSFTAIDRLARAHTIDNGDITKTLNFTLDGMITSIGSCGSSIPASTISWDYRSYDGVLESATYAIANAAAQTLWVWRDAWSRVTDVTNNHIAATYSYSPGTRWVTTNAIAVNGTTVLTRSTVWDLTNSRIASIKWTYGAGSNSSFTYTYKTNCDRVARMTLEDGTYWQYGYDSYAQLISGKRYHASGSNYLGMDFAYNFDTVGNTINAGFVLPSGGPAHEFQADGFNLHIKRVWSNMVEIVGTSTAATNVTITVNNQPCIRDGTTFLCLLPVDNAAGSVETNVVIYVVSNNVVATASGRLFVAKSAEPVTNTPAATIEADSRYSYQFDACDRPVCVTMTNTCPTQRVEFTYYPGSSADDLIGPRATKTVSEWRNGGWITNRIHGFVYDGWNLIHERINCYTGVTAQVTTRDFVWGLDLSGQRSGEWGQEAGGIGGLLAISEASGGITNIYLPMCDHNGNISAVVDVSGQVVARYIYSPFGVLIGEYGTKVDVCPFRFQSKFVDREIGVYCFGYRYYDPASTKWLCNDPLGESQGPNLTAICGNDPVNKIDPLGLETVDDYFKKLESCSELEGLAREESEGTCELGNNLNDVRRERSKLEDRLGYLVATALYAEKYIDRKIDLATLDDASPEFLELENAVKKDDRKSWIPVYGSARESGRAAGEDSQIAASFHGAMCAVDVFIVTGIGRKAALKGIALAGAKSLSVAEVRQIVAEWYARQPISSRAGCIRIGPDAAENASKVFSKGKQALVDMAKVDARKGATKADMKAYKELNKELPDPFPANKVRGPEAHPSRSPHSQEPHGHVGPVDHIPITDAN